MKKMNFSDLNKEIFDKKNEVDRTILRTKSNERLMRKRPRDEDEAKILDELSILRWKKAEMEGKVKYIDERVWYYDFD